MMFKRLISFSILLFLCSTVTFAQKQIFDSGWKFKQADLKGAESPGYNDAGWRTLDLPHDWSIEGEYDKSNPMGASAGYLPAGIGWYRKTIDVPANWKGKHVEIAFDGVFMNSTVYANGKKLGTRPLGWVSFAYDISDQVNQSNTITFAVRVDNSLQPAARWYTGSGIYGHTWLYVKNKIHVPQSGIFVTTKGGTATVKTEISNTAAQDKQLRIKTSIIDKQGKSVAAVQSNLAVKQNQKGNITQNLIVPNPALWSVEEPNLYTLLTEIFDGKNLIEKESTRFGFRDIEWKPETGMWINGKNVKLRGVCNHQDAGAFGAAVPDKILKFRIQQLKDMGVNAIRTAHNAQTPAFYQYCDEMGMMVMDEFFDGWKTKAAKDYGNQAFAEWWERDLSDLVKRDRNHPSIVMYSVGNETEGEVAKDLVATCHLHDPIRPVTSGHSGSEVMDVFGVNGTSEMMGWFDTLAADRVFIGTENPHTWQVRGFYNTLTWYRDGYPNEKRKPFPIPDLTEKEVFFDDWTTEINKINRKQIFNSSYDNATVRLTARHSIEQLKDIPNYAGSFRWTGHDYIGEAGYVHGGWPFKAFMGGAIDLANFEKDLYYLYQSQWTSKPMVHILPHWTHPNVPLGTEIPVWVYSNADEVELFFNKQSLGKIKPGKTWDKMQCEWMVKWQPGELKAVAYTNGRVVAQKTIRTADAPAKIALSIDGEPLNKTGKDIVQVRVSTTDEKGEFQPHGENRTYFNLIGPAKIKALDNGSPIDVERHYGTDNRIAFYGLTRAYVESTEEAGDINLLAAAILGEKKLKFSNLVSIDHQFITLRGKSLNADVKIYYTTDGAVPTQQSQLYKKPFPVKLGTTVKALVVLNGKEVQQLEERFALDEGFVWEETHNSRERIGEQAEDAKFKGAKFNDRGADFRGKGYLSFDKKAGSYVEWYQENDGNATDAALYIRYSSKVKDKSGTYLRVSNNGHVVQDKLFLENTSNMGAFWNTVKVGIRLERGANTIRLSTVEDVELLIDEIMIK